MAEISGLQLPHVGCDPYGDGDISCTYSLCTYYRITLYSRFILPELQQ